MNRITEIEDPADIIPVRTASRMARCSPKSVRNAFRKGLLTRYRHPVTFHDGVSKSELAAKFEQAGVAVGEPFSTVPEAAAELGCSEAVLRRAISAGRVAGFTHPLCGRLVVARKTLDDVVGGDVVTIREAADSCRVSERTIRRRLDSGAVARLLHPIYCRDAVSLSELRSLSPELLEAGDDDN